MSAGAILIPSQAYTASGTQNLGETTNPTTNLPSIARVEEMVVQLNVTASSAPTSLNVYFQHSVDGGTTWDDFISFTQVTTGVSRQIAQWSRQTVSLGGGTFGGETGSALVHTAGDGVLTAGSVLNGPIGDNQRIKYVIVGTSYTFSIQARFLHGQR